MSDDGRKVSVILNENNNVEVGPIPAGNVPEVPFVMENGENTYLPLDGELTSVDKPAKNTDIKAKELTKKEKEEKERKKKNRKRREKRGEE